MCYCTWSRCCDLSQGYIQKGSRYAVSFAIGSVLLLTRSPMTDLLEDATCVANVLNTGVIIVSDLSRTSYEI